MVKPIFPRDLLEKWFPNDHRMIAAFEEQEEQVEANSSSVAETAALKDATVIVLSANGEFTNERLLVKGNGIELEITASEVRIKVDPDKVVMTDVHPVMLIASAPAELNVPLSGTLISSLSVPTLGNFANDAAAAAGGVPVSGLYRNGSVLMVRVV